MNDARKRNFAFRAVMVAVGVLAAVCVVTGVFVIYGRDARITPAGFQQIRIGMTRTEVHELLGRPGHEQLVMGVVNDPGSMSVNFSDDKQQLRDSGYREYVYDTWFSPTVTISVFVDADDQVVCRYSSGGQSQTFLGRIWPQQRVDLASEQ